MSTKEKKNLIIITHGIDDGIRQVLFSLQYAVTMVNMNLDVTIFLTGLAVRWSYKELAQLRGCGDFVKALDYLSIFVDAGGKVKVCTTCYENEMIVTHKEQEIANTLIKGAELVGLAEVAELSLVSNVLVF